MKFVLNLCLLYTSSTGKSQYCKSSQYIGTKQESYHKKLRQDSCLIKIPAPFDAGKILSDIGQRVYRAAVYDYLEVKMRTCRVAGSADSRYRLSCADMLSDADRYRACKAVSVSRLDSAAVVDDDAVSVAGIASAHALDSTVE